MMRVLLPALALIAPGLLSRPAAAQVAVASPGPDAVSVTVYRAPGRSADSAIQRDFPEGYALITETRRVRIPAGTSTIRFEGVASGIFSESAIVAGLPDGVREKNLDADLLSPRSLYDRALGRRVILKRTNPATGRVSEEQGIIRSSRGGGMVLTTAAGVEAVHCSGLPEAVVYDSVPAGLTPKPTLSVEVESPAAAEAVLTLSYLAGGFDWQANYVATMRPDGKSADLFAWLTLVSSDVTSFVDAGTQVVAGKPNREEGGNSRGQFGGGGKEYGCWRVGPPDLFPPPPPPPPPAPMVEAARAGRMRESSMDEVVVTGSRMARQEELGDFKLYRVPQPVTVAAKAQKQVALMDKSGVTLRAVYVSRSRGKAIDNPQLVLRARNRESDGLGLPLPAGRVAVFQPIGRGAGSRDILIGESSTGDKAVGEDVEFKLDESNAVSVDTVEEKTGERETRFVATIRNANAWPIAYEIEFEPRPNRTLSLGGARTFARNGKTVWATNIPANGTVRLTYRIERRD